MQLQLEYAEWYVLLRVSHTKTHAIYMPLNDEINLDHQVKLLFAFSPP